MGIALIKIKIMPKSLDTKLDEIESKAKNIIKKEKGDNINVEKEPVAFGLNALVIRFARDETLELDELLEKINKMKSVSSAEIIDFRRAIG